jgi:hypothetical protein
MQSIAFGLVMKMNQENQYVDRALNIGSCTVPFIVWGGGGRASWWTPHVRTGQMSFRILDIPHTYSLNCISRTFLPLTQVKLSLSRYWRHEPIGGLVPVTVDRRTRWRSLVSCTPSLFYRRRRDSASRWIDAWMGSRTSLDAAENRRSSCKTLLLLSGSNHSSYDLQP